MPSVESFDQYSGKEKKLAQEPQSMTEAMVDLMKKPTSMIIIVLISVILGMTVQFGYI